MLSPKEKAKELVEKFEPYCYHQRTECALIAVDEILLIAPMMHMEGFGDLTIREYYRKVKREIEAL